MKKLIAIMLLCAMLLSGCSLAKPEPTPVVTESKTVYFASFGSVEGKDAAVVHIVDTVNGEYVDTEKEEVYTFADEAVLESFDLQLTAEPTEASINKMELSVFKRSALVYKGESPIVYKVEVADGKIYSARSELKFFPAAEPAEVLCPKCSKWFKEGIEYDTHECKPAATPSPSPSATPAPTATPTPTATPAATAKPAATEAPRTKQCPVCAKWYSEKDYLYHQCLGYAVACPKCGNWYMAGYDFLTHGCGTNAQRVTCSACGIVFDSKQAYDNHKCQAGGRYCSACGQYFNTVLEFDTHNCSTSQRVTCSACGIVFDSKQAYDNHKCQAGGRYCSACGQYFNTVLEFDSHNCTPISASAQCPYCGIWLTEGNEYRNHVLSCSGSTHHTYTCSECGLVFQSYEAFGNHHCQGITDIYCYGCGRYFATTAEFDSHFCVGNLS